MKRCVVSKPRSPNPRVAERIAPVVAANAAAPAASEDEYQPVWIVHPREGKDGRPDIHFKVCQPQAATPDQIALHAEIEKTLTAIHSLFGSERYKSRYTEVVEKLMMLAQLGLVGVRGDSNPGIAKDALKRLQDEIAELDGARVKNDFLKHLGLWALLLSLPAWLVIIFISFRYNEAAASVPLLNLCCLWSANQMGTWLSFATRKLEIGFFDLSRISEDQLEPAVRLVFTGSLAVIFALTLWAGLFAVQIGDFQANGWVTDPLIAVVLGALTGIAEKALPGSIRNKAEKLIAA